ncbi:SLC13/DASS family transporter [Salmonella enterica]|uniref:SLC13/DASS family transporter n=3 Tax=Salmonella enterica TaxID=28901 RepID=A0A5U5ISS3_SALER|nr:SLC13 family permease [Salmonella enterica]EAA7408524.1 SLC13/DASS family transporter [Salmonella enterica subsp. enterica]EBD0148751.1 SLC13/DASS family transporter [Salmonella enterica subsp. enterica serovar Coeln]EBF2798611.1 SLC13/DASS family transporter [Salmonella enterica subsp. enterica serovar Altona]ECI2870255.1 SLC13/DASS family transporter [Salmonella enterica subsp. enterica serovar Senftenberg]EDL6452291.1 SLC13/DASS family transporter [Salmonella enterica subsp. enterica ser
MEPITLTLCLLVFAIVMFVWEKVPLAVTSMIVCVALVITGVLNIKQAFAGFIDTNVILFVAMFIVGGVITRFAKTEKQLIFTIMVVVGLMSGVLSNTGTAAVLIPVVIGVAAKSGFSRSRLLMPLVFAAALGGNLSLIGAPGNLIAQSALQNIGGGFGFFEYAKIGLPMLICGILYFLTIGYRFLPNNATGGEVGSVGEQRDYSHVPQWKQRLSLVVLIATILGMIFEKKIGVSLAVTGCIGALVLVVSGVLTEKQAYKAIDSQTIFIFGGTLALAKALEMTGAGKLVADYVIGMLGQNSSPFMLLIAVFALSVVMTNFMSNTATTALLVPVSLSIAAGMGADPRAVLMATVIGGSCAYATPIGMPANMMVLSAGGYKFVDYAKAGIPLIIVSTIVSLILLPILFPFHP